VTLLNFMVLGISLLPFAVILGSTVFFFGIVHEGRVVLDAQGRLAVVASLLARFRAFSPHVRSKIAAIWYRKAQARYSGWQPPCRGSINSF
jgi:hypothetical protein